MTSTLPKPPWSMRLIVTRAAMERLSPLIKISVLVLEPSVPFVEGQNRLPKPVATQTSRAAPQEMRPSSLVEGDDYYREGSTVVFTARYHLQRGYCCGNGCRH